MIFFYTPISDSFQVRQSTGQPNKPLFHNSNPHATPHLPLNPPPHVDKPMASLSIMGQPIRKITGIACARARSLSLCLSIPLYQFANGDKSTAIPGESVGAAAETLDGASASPAARTKTAAPSGAGTETEAMTT
jgi:hypothetical protein